MKGVDCLSFSYKPLWKLLIDAGMSKQELRLKTGISSATLTKLNKGQYVSMEVLDKICQLLDCRIEDVIEYQHDK